LPPSLHLFDRDIDELFVGDLVEELDLAVLDRRGEQPEGSQPDLLPRLHGLDELSCQSLLQGSHCPVTSYNPCSYVGLLPRRTAPGQTTPDPALVGGRPYRDGLGMRRL